MKNELRTARIEFSIFHLLVWLLLKPAIYVQALFHSTSWTMPVHILKQNKKKWFSQISIMAVVDWCSILLQWFSNEMLMEEELKAGLCPPKAPIIYIIGVWALPQQGLGAPRSLPPIATSHIQIRWRLYLIQIQLLITHHLIVVSLVQVQHHLFSNGCSFEKNHFCDFLQNMYRHCFTQRVEHWL